MMPFAFRSPETLTSGVLWLIWLEALIVSVAVLTLKLFCPLTVTVSFELRLILFPRLSPMVSPSSV